MKTRRIRDLIVMMTALALAVGAASTGAVAGTPAGTPISPAAAASRISQYLTPLAGEAHRLIYSQSQVLGNDLFGNSELEEYDGSGTPADLGPVQLESSGYFPGFSLVGPMLTSDFDGEAQNGVTWWNLDAHTSGTSTVPGRYLGSSNDGWYYYSNGLVADESTAGVITPVGQPFATLNATVYAADVGPSGVVMADSDGDLVYMTDAGAVTSLQSRWSTYAQKGEGNGVACGGTSATYTVCTVSLSGGDNANTGVIAQLIPLDGSAPSTASDVCMGPTARQPSVALTATALICADDGVSSRSLTANSATATSSYQVGPGIGYGAPETVGAFGKAVVADLSNNTLESTTSASAKPSLLLAAPKSDVTAGELALTSGEISWTSNQPRSGARGADPISVRSRDLSAASGSLRTGASTLTEPAAAWDGVARSGRTIAYLRPSVSNGLTSYTLRVVTPFRTTTVGHVIHVTTIASGNEVLYEAAQTPRHPKRRFLVLNAVTGKSRHITQLDPLAKRSAEAQPQILWGHEIVYLDANKAVRLLDMLTGKTKLIASAGRNADPMIYGSYASWTVQPTSGEPHGVFRDVKTMAKPIALPQGTLIEALSNTGIVTTHVDDPTSGVFSGSFVPTIYYLRGFGSGDSETQILDAPNVELPAQVTDSVIAWIDGANVVRAAAVTPKVEPRPLYLGTPYAPTSLARHKTWRTNLPFSAALTSCKFVLKRKGKTVQTLSCAAGPMRLGDAAIAWKGPRVAGRYNWIATVSGAHGKSTTATGTITVR